MRVNRRGFVKAALGAPIAFERLMASGLAGDGSKAYGSGSFGEWVEDEFGLPAFRYTCDQVHDQKAVTPVGPGILSATDHVHQVGNDRLVAVVSNYGYVQVRQDEGAPKFLNDHEPQRGEFGGGIGFLTGGGETLSTYYPGNAKSFERIFGAGYFRKKAAGESFAIDQVIAAPFGDAPVLLSQVTIANHGKEAAELRWVEYWGCRPYQFSFRSFTESFAGMGTPVAVRRKFSDRFTHRFRALAGGAGLIESKQFLGRAPEEEAAWQKIKTALATKPNPFLGPVQETVPEAQFDDLHPPATFLASLDAAADGFTTDSKKFFGAGGVANPAGLAAALDGNLDAAEGALLLERRFKLQPGERRTLYFLYGYLTAGADAGELIAIYRGRAAGAWAESARQWKRHGLTFETAGEPWVKREVAWNYYYIRSGLTYDDYFGEHILSQGAIYQYVLGFQGAARDPLQHALPFIFSDPGLMKEALRYTLKEVRPDGSIPYALVGHGAIMPSVSDNSSDLPLWLLWAAAEYVLATRDAAFLDEPVTTFPLYGPKAGKEKVRALLARCYRRLIDDVHTGEHSVMRMLQDDWNDALVLGWGQKAHDECVAKGESVLNSAMAAYVFDYYARLLTYAGDPEPARDARAKAEEHRKAAAAQWTGKWLRRAWLGPTLGWLGDDNLWLEPQPWAIVGGVTTPDQTKQLVAAMDEMLRRPSPIGAMQMSAGPDMKRQPLWEPGLAVNGGVWPSLNQTLVWALAKVDKGMAWEEWRKNTLAGHAEVYPDVWYHTWSGSDTLNSALNSRPGQTVATGFMKWTDYPVMNMHSHACTLYSLAKLLGVEFTEGGLRLAPALPPASYRFDSPLLGVVKTAAGYEGWYGPSKAGTWTVAISLPEAEMRCVRGVRVNGARARLAPASALIELKGPSAPGKPLRWSLDLR